MPWSIHLHTEIYQNLKSISELFKMYMKVSIILYKHHAIMESCATIHSAVSAFTETSSFSSRASHQCLWDIAVAWLAVFSRHNEFAETHSHLQLSYHITDRLLGAGNNVDFCKKQAPLHASNYFPFESYTNADDENDKETIFISFVYP